MNSSATQRDWWVHCTQTFTQSNQRMGFITKMLEPCCLFISFAISFHIHSIEHKIFILIKFWFSPLFRFCLSIYLVRGYYFELVLSIYNETNIFVVVVVVAMHIHINCWLVHVEQKPSFYSVKNKSFRFTSAAGDFFCAFCICKTRLCIFVCVCGIICSIHSNRHRTHMKMYW